MKKFLVIAAFLGFFSVSASMAQAPAPVVASDRMEVPVAAHPQEEKKAEATPAKSCCQKGGAKSSCDSKESKEVKASAAGKSSCCQKGHTEAKATPVKEEKKKD
ncbi:hypothetical protein BH11BAC2_BH11BAC2_23400 [soil metagenome]